MPHADVPNSGIQTKLKAICREISITQSLDAEIQKELYGHMEDKLLAYVNGEEAITEDDALILVREHFGKPANDQSASGGYLCERNVCIAGATSGCGLHIILWYQLYKSHSLACRIYAFDDRSTQYQ